MIYGKNNQPAETELEVLRSAVHHSLALYKSVADILPYSKTAHYFENDIDDLVKHYPTSLRWMNDLKQWQEWERRFPT